MRALYLLIAAACVAAAAPIPTTTCSPVRSLLDSAAGLVGLRLDLCRPQPPQEEHHAYQDPGYYPEGVDLDETNYGEFERLPDFHDEQYEQSVSPRTGWADSRPDTSIERRVPRYEDRETRGASVQGRAAVVGHGE